MIRQPATGAGSSRERELIAALVAQFRRSPLQRNAVHESDAELVKLPGGDAWLAVTTDSVVEEIETGLYDDPYLIGWMTVTVNASDLAAVGAEPVGILLSETLPRNVTRSFVSRLQRGVADASTVYELPVLGGDTNFASRLHMGGTAVGVVSEPPLTRRGCQSGDALFATGPLGLGAAFALARLGDVLTHKQASDQPDGLASPRPSDAVARPGLVYRPTARIREGRVIRNIASACIDTSDGVIPALDELMRQNDVGVLLSVSVDGLLDPRARCAAAAAALPLWTPLAGPHGEFELLFTMPERNRPALLARALASGWWPLEIGRVVAEPGLWLQGEGHRAALDAGAVRNLFTEVAGDVEAYAAALRRMDDRLRAGLRTARA